MDIDTLKRARTSIQTARLRLEQPQASHAAVVMAAVNASLADLRFIDWGVSAFDMDRARKFCERDIELVASGQCLIYFAFERASGAFVGNLDLHSFDFSVPRCQIGYVGDSRLARRGLMGEAAEAMIQFAFSLGVQRVEAYCDARNERSIRFAERLGLVREGVLRSFARDPQGALNDEVVLARLAGDSAPLVQSVMPSR